MLWIVLLQFHNTLCLIWIVVMFRRLVWFVPASLFSERHDVLFNFWIVMSGMSKCLMLVLSRLNLCTSHGFGVMKSYVIFYCAWRFEVFYVSIMCGGWVSSLKFHLWSMWSLNMATLKSPRHLTWPLYNHPSIVDTFVIFSLYHIIASAHKILHIQKYTLHNFKTIFPQDFKLGWTNDYCNHKRSKQTHNKQTSTDWAINRPNHHQKHQLYHRRMECP